MKKVPFPLHVSNITVFLIGGQSWLNFEVQKSLSLEEHVKASAVNRPPTAAEQELWRSSRSDGLRAKFVRPGFPSRGDGALFHWWATTVGLAQKIHTKSRGVRNGQGRSRHFG